MDKKRNYSVSFIYVIDIPLMDKSMYTKYKNHWYTFMTYFWSGLVSRKNLMSLLPDMRQVCSDVNKEITVEKLYPLLEKKGQEDLVKKLVLCSPFFDYSPIELKSAILVRLGVDADEIEDFYTNVS